MIPLLSPHKRLSHRKRVLFICSGNACRSQIAEGWTRALFGGQIEAASAGIEAHGLDPYAVRVMAEKHVDISRQRSKPLDAVALAQADLIVTLSERASSHLRTLRITQPVVHVHCLSPARRVRIGEASPAHYRALRDELLNAVFMLVLGHADAHRPAVAV